MELNKKFEHKQTEAKKYENWLNNKIFVADTKSDKKHFTVILPPPNVTGQLHLGHAWDGTLQDILIRYKKMQGFETLWIPGMDHAGIATQAKVEERLREEGISRYDLGREEFLKRSWGWKEEYAEIIRSQWAKMGFALDYSQEKFTLDSDVNRAVNTVFVKLYEKGLIYQGNRITNWDPKAMTALSDIEVIHKEVEGKFYYLKYKFVNKEGYLEVATTRPETCFGDVCLVVHPEDSRALQLKDELVIIPGTDRQIPIILDDYVDPEFGSGIVKITPAHDPNDFMVGKRHDLEMPIVMNLDGTMNQYAGKYEGLDRFDCRKQYISDLQNLDLIIKIDEHIHNVGHSERTNVVVEPILSKQWYVKMEELAQMSLDNQNTDGKVNFVPERFENTFKTWMENIQDWCISRQLWWGHQIPAWYHNQTGEVYVGMEVPEDSENYTRDSDVLDTWFSSALWPFATTIWSDNSKELERFYPTDVLVTGYDIIFFWVARMIFQSLEFTDEAPFSDVLIHGLIRDEEGRKMSKSLGNGINPMDVIDSHGADALRFFLTTNSAPGQDLRYSTEKMDASWNFINKVWNISRYVLMNTSEIESLDLNPHIDLFDSSDSYIIQKLDEVINHVNEMMEKYEFGEVARSLYNFIWDDFASWYVEISKIALQNEDIKIQNKTKTVLRYVNVAIVKMLHPFMPFVTEEIYTQIDSVDSILLTSWPTESGLQFDKAKIENFESIKELIIATRTIRSENDIKPSLEINALVTTDLKFDIIDLNILKNMARFASLVINEDTNEDTIIVVTTHAKLEILTEGAIDLEAKQEKLLKQLDKLTNEIKRSEKMLTNERFVSNAKPEKIEEEKNKARSYVEQYEEIFSLIASEKPKFEIAKEVTTIKTIL